jgi:hypothetical protein
VLVWVWLPAWRVVEGDGREKKRFARSCHALGLGFPLSLSNSKFFQTRHGWGDARGNAGHLPCLGAGY